jgi:hypothetical protein
MEEFMKKNLIRGVLAAVSLFAFVALNSCDLDNLSSTRDYTFENNSSYRVTVLPQSGQDQTWEGFYLGVGESMTVEQEGALYYSYSPATYVYADVDGTTITFGNR